MTTIFSSTGLIATQTYETMSFNSDSLIRATVSPVNFGVIDVTLRIIRNIPLSIPLADLEKGKLNFRIPSTYSGSQVKLILVPSTDLDRLIIDTELQVDYNLGSKVSTETQLDKIEGKVNQILVNLGLPTDL